VAYICAIILIPLFGLSPVFLGWMFYPRFADADLSTIAFMVVITLIFWAWFWRNLFLFVRFLKTLSVECELQGDGVVVKDRGNKSFYRWESLSKSKEYADCQIFCLVTSDGNHLFSIWEYANGYGAIRAEAKERIGI
jgi:hypothetical protein